MFPSSSTSSDNFTSFTTWCEQNTTKDEVPWALSWVHRLHTCMWMRLIHRLACTDSAAKPGHQVSGWWLPMSYLAAIASNHLAVLDVLLTNAPNDFLTPSDHGLNNNRAVPLQYPPVSQSQWSSKNLSRGVSRQQHARGQVLPANPRLLMEWKERCVTFLSMTVANV